MLLRRVPSSSSPSKGLYNPKAFITHAASLDQGCPHCPRFPTAASRRSLGRVSVPVWLIVLSDQLPITALVGRYPTNQLIGRGPLPSRPTQRIGLWPPLARGRHPVLAAVSRGCPEARGRFPRATHPSATRAAPEGTAPVRLACVRRAASVRSEPGSNSQLDLPPPKVSLWGTGSGPNGITAQGRPLATLRRPRIRSKATGPKSTPAAPTPRAPSGTFRHPKPPENPGHRRRGLRPATFPQRCLSHRDPKAAAHASLPLFTNSVQRTNRRPPRRSPRPPANVAL